MSANNNIKRNKILESHKLFGNFLNLYVISSLISLFNNKDSNDTIIKYIQDERKEKGLDNNIEFKSYFYGNDVDNPTLVLILIKNNDEFIHLTIHLSIKHLESESAGIIHFYKNIYKTKTKKKERKFLYGLITITQPKEKPNSLEFSITDGYITNGFLNSHIYDKELQQEMDIIITVLNRIFDENNSKYYIGNNKLISINNQINKTAEILNKYQNYTKRRNKGKTYFGITSNTPKINIEYRGKTQRNNKLKLKKRNFKIEILPQTNNIKNNNISLFLNKEDLNNT
jgi:hypothetical protein